MKKTVLSIALVATLIFGYALNYSIRKSEICFDREIDGDSFYLYIDGKEQECRLIGVNAPECNSSEPYAKEAKEYTNKLLKNARKITIELDTQSDTYDKYGRYLVWVFVDGELLQTKLLEEGLAEVKFIYGNYKYLDECYKAENIAKEKKLNIWSE